MLVIGADAELVRSLEVLLAGHPPRRIVNPNIVQQESGIGPLVVPTDVGAARDTVEYHGDSWRARASTAENGPDRDRLFAMMVEVIPGAYGYQDKCRDQRQIPVVRLQRI